jgi:midasin (ATPase involved in ribosome maturation)
MRHEKYDYVKTLIENGVSVLLEGQSGSGKTHLLMDIVKDLNQKFYSITGTQQTSVANLLGFRSVTGEYIGTQFREAYEFGGTFTIEELSGMSANTLLALNSIDNGFISFPDKVVYQHKNFILCATDNPIEDSAIYTGRSKQDAAVMDRFLIVDIPLDPALEESLTSKDTVVISNQMRKLLKDHGVRSRTISMRDSKRYHKLTELANKGLITEDPLDCLVGKNIELKEALTDFTLSVKAAAVPLDSVETLEEVYDLLKKKEKVNA